MYSSAKLLIEKGADPKVWATGKRPIFPGNGWFRPGYAKVGMHASRQAAYYELYDFLAAKGYLPPRDDTGGDESSEKNK
jgi:hypothetical protein